ncbi:MAG: hypothetical protein F2793_01355 [Actinobacteria bacterium]|uniref:Unannotated protein n=1 Tax=freshwater metagenome TaxID=449393 RepID=A0A6J7CZH6_9ZZZZ|nr:hypothetical protein [Actinomycetota bacterium]
MKRAFTTLVALLVLAASVALLGGAAWMWSTFGSQGVITSALGRLSGSPSSQAVLFDIASVGIEIPTLPIHGTASIVATSAGVAQGSTEILLATAPADIANEYLAGGRYDVGQFTDGAWATRQVPGVRDLDAPNSVDWTASAVGLAPRIPLGQELPVTVVVMNASGGPPVSVLLSLELRLPETRSYATTLAAFGVGLLFVGLILLWLAVSRMRRRGGHETGSHA